MTYKERMAAFCQQCEHHSTCGWVKAGTIDRCFDIQGFMEGWEYGQKDTLEEIEKYIGNNNSLEAEFIKDKIEELKKDRL